MISLIVTVLIFVTSFLLVLSFLVFFHELGHYSVGRFFKVPVERFSIGFGKPIYKRKAKSGTEWTIGSIPLGGYVKFLGDAGAASNPDTERLAEIRSELEADGHQKDISNVFHFKPVWQRALIVLAGPVANFILAVFLFALVAMIFGTEKMKSVITQFTENSAAQDAGMQVEDHIIRLNGHDVSLHSDLQPYVAIRSGVKMEAIVLRNGEELSFEVSPRRVVRKDHIGGDNEMGSLGVWIGGQEHYQKIEHNPISAVGHGWEELNRMVGTTGAYIGRIFMGKEDGKAFGGPVKIATVTGKSMVDIFFQETPLGQRLKTMFYVLLTLSASISIGLGVANLMPIPALDGGHLLYYGYEALAGRPLSEKKQEVGFRIGFALIATLLVYFTINDVGWIQSMRP